MKKIIYSCCLLWLACMSVLPANAQNYFTEKLLPRYIYGNGTTGRNIAPYVYRARLNGLLPSTVYLYNNAAVRVTDSKSSYGYGSTLMVNENTDFLLNTDFTSLIPSAAGTFTTDANGAYEGWFMLLPTNRAQFAIGNEIQLQINILSMDDAQSTGTSEPSARFYSSSTVKVIGWGAASTNATAIRSTAAAAAHPKNFVMLYDTDAPSASDRPIAGACIESDGFDMSSIVSTSQGLASFLKDDVDKTDGAWGTYIPNDLSGGIKRIVRYKFDGTQAGADSAANGLWPGLSGTTVNTANASGGITTVLVLDGSAVKLAAPPKLDAGLAFPTGLPSQVYTGDPDFNAAVTTSSAAAVTYSSSNEAVATIDASGLVHITGAGTTVLKAVQEENATYDGSTITATLLVSVPKINPSLAFTTSFPSTILVSAADFNAAATSNSPETIVYASSNIAVATIDATGLVHLTGVGTTEITASQAGNATYNAATVAQMLTVVDKQVPDVTFLPFSARIYGDAPFALSATASSGATVTYSTDKPSVAQVVNGQVVIAGAGTAVITAYFPATGNYSQASISRTLNVQKANLSIIAENKTKKQGDINPVFTATYAGLVNGDTYITALQTQVQLTTTAVTASPAGTYPINASSAVAANYEIAYVPGVLTIEPVIYGNVISFPTISRKTYGQADFEAGAVASSGLTVAYASSNPDVAVVSGTKLHITGAGTTVITATQAGDATHETAVAVSQTLTVNKAVLLATAADASRKQGEANPAFSVGYTGFVNGDDKAVLSVAPTVNTSASTGSPAGIYNLVPSGAVADDYDVVYANGKLTIYPATGIEGNEVVAYCDAQGQLKISLYVQASYKVNIQLYDASGKKVLDMPVTLNKGYNIYHINVNRLSPGIYPLRVAGGDLLLRSKAVIR